MVKKSGIPLLILKLLVGLAFLASGGGKLAGVPAMVELFARIGFGQGFRYITGALEVLGAIGLFVPALTFYAATLLAAVMVGAIAFHLAVIGGSPAAPISLLLLLIAIAWLSRAGRRIP
jgi:uncharacterized membrane protein YphA (DoxX/SURF4 family)